MGIPQTVAEGSRSVRRRRLILSAAALAAAPALAGCAASFNAPTSEPYQPAAGISDRSGAVYALDTLVVANDAGDGTVVTRLVNQQAEDDSLDSFTAVDSNGDPITTSLAQPLSLPAAPSSQQSVQVGTSGALRLTGDTVVPGQFVKLTFTFDKAAPVTVDVPVIPSSNPIYAEIPVGPAPSSAPASSSPSSS